VWYGSAIRQRLYLPRRSDDLLPQLFAVTKAALVAVMVAVFLLALSTRGQLEREFVLLLGIAMLVLLLLFRSMVRLSLWGLRVRGFNAQHILLVGANKSTTRLVESIMAHDQYGYQIDGFLEDDPERAELVVKYGVPYLGKIENLEDLLVNRVIDWVYVTLPMRSSYETILNIAHLCEAVGVPVRLVADLIPLGSPARHLWQLEDVPLVSLTPTRGVEAAQLARRLTDWVVSTMLLVVLSPLFLLIAVLIKLDSKGPVFVRQPRVGRDGKSFTLVSFRYTEVSGDPDTIRLTGFGRHLRRYNLDELPQLLNVWCGHISLVGPKPLTVAEGVLARSGASTGGDAEAA
jgi:hypothetical protein